MLNANETEKKTKKDRINQIATMINALSQTDRAHYSKLLSDLVSDEKNTLLHAELNKIDELVIAVARNHTIYLFSRAYQTVMYAPKLMFHIESQEHLHIDDVLDKTHSIGNGSALMRALLIYAQINGVHLITGHLSDVDNNHKERRDSYYMKFGFDVKENNISKTIQG